MIKITFQHLNNIAGPNGLQKWLINLFPSATFEGCEYGDYYPTVQITLKDWQENHFQLNKLPTNQLVKMEGKFDILQKLAFGVRDFSNDLREIQKPES